MTTSEITTRAATAADTGAMSDLAYRSKKANGYDDQVMALFEEGLHITPQRLARLRFWVAEGHCHGPNKILGCIALEPVDLKTAEVRTFFTDPAYQGRGIGTQLFHTLLTDAQAQGITRLQAHADPITERYYANLGFVTQSEVASRSIPNKSVPFMSRET